MSTILVRVSPFLRRHVRIPALLIGFVALAVVGVMLTDPLQPERAELAASPARHTFRPVTTDAAFRAGTNEGTRVASGSLTMARDVGRISYGGRSWAWARWTSGWVSPGHRFNELVPSWNVVTPADTWVMVQARVRSNTGRASGWKVMARWSTRDAGFRRASAGSQTDKVATVSADTLRAVSGVSLTGYQLRVVPARKPGIEATPVVRSVQAVASRTASVLPATSKPLLGARSLTVPRYSQMTHRGEYPQYGGGGQAWCSPTSLSMLLGYRGKLPSRANYSWVRPGDADPWVDHVARVVYDYGYRGAGNWAFNTAYASVLTGNAYVTRLTNLRAAEKHIAAGTPLAASISFGRGQLKGAPISATNGHLVVITGFTSAGNVIVNDPAAPSNGTVRRVYDRGQFERAWLRKSSGTVYVVR